MQKSEAKIKVLEILNSYGFKVSNDIITSRPRNIEKQLQAMDAISDVYFTDKSGTEFTFDVTGTPLMLGEVEI